MENKQQPVVNICGSCILRDTFYYQGVYGKEKDGGYRINRYVNFFSPLALEQPPIPIYDRAAYEAFDLKPFGLTNFFRRWMQKYFRLNRCQKKNCGIGCRSMQISSKRSARKNESFW